MGSRAGKLASLTQYAEGRARVAAATIFETEISTKRSFAIVTAHATRAAAGGEVFRRAR
jgi:hypothetical protein